MAWYMAADMTAYIYSSLLIVLISCPFLDAAVPEQVRLSFGDTPQEMVVMWACEENLAASITYGTDIRLKNKDEVTATVAELTDTNSDGLQFLYRAKLQNLTPDMLYYYKVVLDNLPSDVKFFHVPPDGMNWSPQLLVLGDMDLSTDLTLTLVQASQDENDSYTGVMFTGNHKTAFRRNGGKSGDDTFESLQTALSRLPYLTTTGSADVQNDTFLQFRHRISYPGRQWPLSTESLWYSIDIGPAHIISYSTDVSHLDKQVVDHQHNWLITDLAKANRERVNRPWVIAFGNQPMYCSNMSAPNDECALKESDSRTLFEDIFFQYGVDLVINGASSAYERMWPVYKGTIHADNYTNPTAPIYLRVGTGMVEEPVFVKPDIDVKVDETEDETDKDQTITRRELENAEKEIDKEANTNNTKSKESNQPDSWSAFRLSDLQVPGYGCLRIVNSTHLRWEFLSTKQNAILDSLWIVTKDHGQFVTVSPDEESFPVEIVTTAVNDHTDSDAYNGTSEHKDFFQMLKEKLQTRNGMIVAISSGVGLLVFISCACCLIIRRRRRNRASGRRWERLDYEKSYYSDYSDVSTHADDGFEETELTADGNMSTSKLLPRSGNRTAV